MLPYQRKPGRIGSSSFPDVARLGIDRIRHPRVIPAAPRFPRRPSFELKGDRLKSRWFLVAAESGLEESGRLHTTCGADPLWAAAYALGGRVFARAGFHGGPSNGFKGTLAGRDADQGSDPQRCCLPEADG
jgi:hypothetical protein